LPVDAVVSVVEGIKERRTGVPWGVTATLFGF
jgi:hypothetical protein